MFLLSSIAHGYAQQNILVNSRLVGDNGSVDFYVELTLDTRTTQLYNLAFNFYSGVKDGQPNEVEVTDSVYITGKANVHYLRFTMPQDSLSEKINMEVVDKGTRQTHIYQQAVDEREPLILYQDGRPVMYPYVQQGQYTFADSTSVTAFYYNHDFNYSAPPMTFSAQASQSMDIRETYTVQGTVVLDKEGLYLFQKDTLSNSAMVIRVVPPYYPKMATVAQLTGPLNYISTNDERTKLDAIGNDKKLFDRYWLDLSGKPEIAIKTIKGFYDRVEEANRRYTSFKEGWKSDMGMVYIVMGEPDNIERAGDKVVWLYNANRLLPKRKYEFIKTSTIFSPAHYVLLREKEHASAWYDAIDLIRKGIFK